MFVANASKILEQPLFSESIKLKDLCEIKITSPNEQKDQEASSKSNIQELSDKNNRYDDKIITALRAEVIPDSVYNFKKDFLVLSYDQTEDQNSIEYKRKILSQKLMTDVTFSLNKAFEFTFQDKIKNNIISTLSKNARDQIYSDTKLDESNIDNNFILNLCSNNFSIEDIWGDKNDQPAVRERRETFLGMKNSTEEIDNTIMEDEIVHAKRNYFPDHVFNICFNYEEDDEFDQATYDFFIRFIDKHKATKLSSKIKLVLSYINEINPDTGKPIFSNKMKNEKLRFWKNEYDKALEMYTKQIQEKKDRRSEDGFGKSRKSYNFGSRIASPYVTGKKIPSFQRYQKKNTQTNLNEVLSGSSSVKSGAMSPSPKV